jgi:hypothetical protein
MTGRKAANLLLCGLFAVTFASFSFAQTSDPAIGPAIAPSDNSNVVPAWLVLRRLTAPSSFTHGFSETDAGDSSSASDQASAAQGRSNESSANAQSNAQNPAPSNNPQAPSLQDLGLSPSQTQADPQLQARLDKRAHMLKIHQRLGLITAIPMIATVATSFGAGGRSTSTSDRWAHLALGAATGDLYFTTAYFAIRAPGIPGTQRRGPIRVHRALAWIHGPGMILTPILGAIAFNQKSKGEKVHGIASAHGPVAIVTAGAFGAALLSVSLKF